MSVSGLRREDFPAFDRFTYLNTASAGLVPAPVVRPAHEFEAELAQAGTTGMDEDTEVGILEGARNAAAQLLGADPSTIAIGTSFTEALCQVAWWLRPGKGQNVVSSEVVPKGDVVLGVKFTREKEEPKGCANGAATLYINDKAVGKATIRTQPGKFALAGEGLVIGRMGADSVTKEYKAPFPSKGVTVKSVAINVSGGLYRDLETEALAMLSKE